MSREMKDSGIPWIGEIPEGWNIGRIKDCTDIIMGQSPDGDSITSEPIGYPFMQGNAEFTFKYPNPIHYCSNPNKLSREGDILMSVRAPIGALNLSDKVYGIGRGLCSIKCVNINQNYLWYYLQKSSADFDYFGNGSTFSAITVSSLYNFPLLLPPLSEQQTIVNFLDKKCNEIDELITLQEQMIEELKAYKQSVITEAVTKGIRNEELGVRNYKDSGIEWIGEVPEEWKVCRIKDVASLFGRIGFRGYTSDDLNKDGDGAITLSPSNMLPMGMDYTNVTYLSWMKYHESPEIMIQNGDILMVKTGSSYGKVSYVDNLPQEATINPQILRIVAKINSKYLGYYLQTLLFIYQVEGGVVGGTIPTISQEKINNFFVVNPPLSEQQAIADYLDDKCADIDSLIQIKQEKIDSLKEYKKSVIYEYVTGKREV